jgi:diguanylate cyclase (GGDEF)-like protein
MSAAETSEESSHSESRESQLLLEIKNLRQEMIRLQKNNEDLQIAVETIASHGDIVVAQLQEEIAERKRAEAALKSVLNRVAQNKADLEIILQTTVEHGDTVETELHDANNQLEREIAERKKAEAALRSILEIVSRDKIDLEIRLEIASDHGDALLEQLEKDKNEARNIAVTDSLTQVANRRKLDQYLIQEWEKMEREKLPISFVLCDIDFFKLYNDYYGHQAGDRCLINVAQTISHAVKRPLDLVARYGGEEFAVILPNTSSQAAIQVAEIIWTEVQKQQIPHHKSLTSEYVTLSIGVSSTVPLRGTSPESLIAVADRALYEAKKQGRNCVVFKSCNALTAFRTSI